MRHALRARIMATLIALGIAVLGAGTQAVGHTEAAWVDGEHAVSTVTAGELGAPAPDGCVFQTRAFTPRWTPPPAPSVAPKLYQYRLYWDGALTPERLVVDWTSTGSTLGFTYTLPSTIASLGVYRFEVRAVAGSWVSPVREGTATVIALLGLISIDGCSWN